MTIETHDIIGGTYLDDLSGGRYGNRLNDDRRFWMAWKSRTDHSQDMLHAVMDDFGTLVETWHL